MDMDQWNPWMTVIQYLVWIMYSEYVTNGRQKQYITFASRTPNNQSDSSK